jgi:translation initiation factor eIF-2B subunit beta
LPEHSDLKEHTPSPPTVFPISLISERIQNPATAKMATAQVSYAPDLKKFLKTLNSKKPEASVAQLAALLKRRQITGPEPCATATAYTLLQVVAQSKWTDVDTLLSNVEEAGRRLSAAQPHERTIANMTRRILATIRNEAEEDRADDVVGDNSTTVTGASTPQRQQRGPTGGEESPRSPPSRDASVPRTLFNLLAPTPPQPAGATFEGLAPKSKAAPAAVVEARSRKMREDEVHKLKVEVVECIQEFRDEIESVVEMISGMTDIPLYPRDAVLLFDPSPAVERLILRIASKKKFAVYLAASPTVHSTKATTPETADGSRTAVFRRKLVAAGVMVVTLKTSSMMAYMPRITKVFLDAHAVAADGGFIAGSGAGVVARAAAVHGRPVFVIAGVYQLSPDTPHDRQEWVAPGSGAARVGFSNGALVQRVRVRSPDTEWVDGSMVDIYVTSLGMHSREQLREVIADTYNETSARDAGGD